MYRYFNVSPCYAMEGAQRRDIRGRAEARVTAFRRAGNPFSPSGGRKFLVSYFRNKSFGNWLRSILGFCRLLLFILYIYIGSILS